MSARNLEAMVAELVQAQKETDRQMKETGRQMEETDRRMKETDEKIKKLSDLFGDQWGKLVEALMRPGTVELFRKRGLPVTQMTERREGIDSQGRTIEVGMTLISDETIVAVEIRTRCKVEDVDWHIDKLHRFKQAFKEYANWELQGAVAALRFAEESDRYAYRRGLWVLKCTDGITRLVNDPNFKPAAF